MPGTAPIAKWFKVLALTIRCQGLSPIMPGTAPIAKWFKVLALIMPGTAPIAKWFKVLALTIAVSHHARDCPYSQVVQGIGTDHSLTLIMPGTAPIAKWFKVLALIIRCLPSCQGQVVQGIGTDHSLTLIMPGTGSGSAPIARDCPYSQVVQGIDH